jgi:hypothetical protein
VQWIVLVCFSSFFLKNSCFDKWWNTSQTIEEMGKIPWVTCLPITLPKSEQVFTVLGGRLCCFHDHIICHMVFQWWTYTWNGDHNVFVEHDFFVLSLNMLSLNVMKWPFTLAHYVGCVAMLALGRFTGAT